jgi:hypothetical protein
MDTDFTESALEQPTNSSVMRRLRRKEAAAYVEERHGIPCAPKTLAKYAVIGGGPIFRKAGKTPLYSAYDLDAWAESKLSKPVRSTSELREVA